MLVFPILEIPTGFLLTDAYLCLSGPNEQQLGFLFLFYLYLYPFIFMSVLLVSPHDRRGHQIPL